MCVCGGGGLPACDKANDVLAETGVIVTPDPTKYVDVRPRKHPFTEVNVVQLLS